MRNALQELLLDLLAPEIPAIANITWTNTGAAAVACGATLVAEERYYAYATEDCYLAPESTIAGATATTSSMPVPAGKFVPFSPKAGFLFASCIRATVNGKVAIIPANNCRVGSPTP